MRLVFQKPYNSIEPFDPVDLPNFTVLTGVNGAGKTHLMEAIRDGQVAVEGLASPLRIAHFDYASFKLDNEQVFNAQKLESERSSAWRWYEENVRAFAEKCQKNLGDGYEALKKSCEISRTPLWNADEEKTKTYCQQIESFFIAQTQKLKNKQQKEQAEAVFFIIKQLPFSLNEIDQDTFNSYYRPYVFKNDFLPAQLGKAFWDYYIRYERNQYYRFRNEKNGEAHETLTDEAFEKINGPKPWVVVNKVLSEFDTLTYEVTTPEGVDMFSGFQLKLRHTNREDLEIDFSQLSSGERVLMALVASIYKGEFDRHFPGLLLLDEVDASLHPSMMKNMLGAIEAVFLDHGVRVVLVTHSPTTIALAPEGSIFLMHPSGQNRFGKATKSEALDVLTQGFVTLDRGMRIVDEITTDEVTIITEGYNTRIIEKALKLYDVSGVTVIHGLEDKSGKNTLKTIFEFLSRIKHDGRVLIVWDCDVSPDLSASNNTFPYSIPKNERNTLTSKGIENAFPEKMFVNFVKVTTPAKGQEIKQFDSACKKDFAENVIAQGTKEDFSHFSGLIEEISRIKALP